MPNVPHVCVSLKHWRKQSSYFLSFPVYIPHRRNNVSSRTTSWNTCDANYNAFLAIIHLHSSLQIVLFCIMKYHNVLVNLLKWSNVYRTRNPTVIHYYRLRWSSDPLLCNTFLTSCNPIPNPTHSVFLSFSCSLHLCSYQETAVLCRGWWLWLWAAMHLSARVLGKHSPLPDNMWLRHSVCAY